MAINYRGDRWRVSLLPRCRELRRRSTPAERELWDLLRGRQLEGLKFRRQHQFGPCIIDFYCAESRLALEVDGRQHSEPMRSEYDDARSEYLAAQGVQVVRFTNEEVLCRPRDVVSRIREAVRAG